MNDKTYISQHIAAPTPARARFEGAAESFAKVLHLWACGYTTASIAREVPSMTRAQIVDLVNLAHEVARVAPEGQRPVSIAGLMRAHSARKGGAK